MNTEQTTYLGALITAYGNACYEFGARDSLGTEHEEEYARFENKADEAKRALLEEIARVRTAVPVDVRKLAVEAVCGSRPSPGHPSKEPVTVLEINMVRLLEDFGLSVLVAAKASSSGDIRLPE
jgi:hypothetical protein